MRSTSRFAIAFGAVLIAGCATHYSAEAQSDPYGFFTGIWHGLIFPYALVANVVSWVADLIGFSVFRSIEIIGRPNSGAWYYVGFACGLSCLRAT